MFWSFNIYFEQIKKQIMLIFVGEKLLKLAETWLVDIYSKAKNIYLHVGAWKIAPKLKRRHTEHYPFTWSHTWLFQNDIFRMRWCNWEEVPFKLTTWNDNGCNTANMIMAMLSIGRPYAIQKWFKRKRTSVRVSPSYLKQNERRNECHVKWNENWGKKNGRRQEKVSPLWAMLYVTTDWIINNLLPSCAGDVDDVKCEIVNFLSPLDHNVRIIGSCWSNVTQSVDVIDIESRGRSSHSCECAPTICLIFSWKPFHSANYRLHFVQP